MTNLCSRSHPLSSARAAVAAQLCWQQRISSFRDSQPLPLLVASLIDVPCVSSPVVEYMQIGTQTTAKRVKQPAAPIKRRFSGEHLPTYRNAELLYALGATEQDLDPAVFSNAFQYTKMMLRLAHKHWEHDEQPLLLSLRRPAKHGLNLKSCLDDRIPGHWPPHPLIKPFLQARPELRDSQELIDGCETMADQLELLERCSGWTSVLPNGFINPTFSEGLDCLLQMNMFGVSFAEVRSETHRCSTAQSTTETPLLPRHRKLAYHVVCECGPDLLSGNRLHSRAATGPRHLSVPCLERDLATHTRTNSSSGMHERIQERAHSHE